MQNCALSFHSRGVLHIGPFDNSTYNDGKDLSFLRETPHFFSHECLICHDTQLKHRLALGLIFTVIGFLTLPGEVVAFDLLMLAYQYPFKMF